MIMALLLVVVDKEIAYYVVGGVTNIFIDKMGGIFGR